MDAERKKTKQRRPAYGPDDAYVEKLEKRLTEVVVSEYEFSEEEAYVSVEEISTSYICGEPYTVLSVSFGRLPTDGQKNGRWQKSMKLDLTSDSIEFVAGQFFQALAYVESNE